MFRLKASERACRIRRVIHSSFAKYKICCVKESLLFVNECSDFARFRGPIKTIDYRKSKAMFIDGFSCILLRIHGQRYDANSHLRKFILLIVEFSQLLKTERSPVPTIEEHYVPFVIQSDRYRQGFSINRLAFDFRKRVSVFQLHSLTPFFSCELA